MIDRTLLQNIPKKEEIKVLFVCLGNICRSPAAQAVFEKIVADRCLQTRLKADSAGTYGGHSGQMSDRRMRTHAIRRDYNLTHLARKVQPWDFEDFDLIVAMDQSNAADLRRLAPSVEAARKIVMMTDFCRHNDRWDYVPDPYYEGAEGFELVLDLLEDACENLVDCLAN